MSFDKRFLIIWDHTHEGASGHYREMSLVEIEKHPLLRGDVELIDWCRGNANPGEHVAFSGFIVVRTI